MESSSRVKAVVCKAQSSHPRSRTYTFITLLMNGLQQSQSHTLKVKPARFATLTIGDRLRATLKRMREYLRRNLNIVDTPNLISQVMARVRGWVNYHAVSGNQRQVGNFIHQSQRVLFNWLNRRGGRKKWSWDRFTRLLQRINYPTQPKTVSLSPTPNRAKA